MSKVPEVEFCMCVTKDMCAIG